MVERILDDLTFKVLRPDAQLSKERLGETRGSCERGVRLPGHRASDTLRRQRSSTSMRISTDEPPLIACP
jgi:hypothetical protein